MSNVLMFAEVLQAELHYKTFGHTVFKLLLYDNCWAMSCRATPISLGNLLPLLLFLLLPLSNSGICWFYDCMTQQQLNWNQLKPNRSIYSCVIFSITNIQCFTYNFPNHAVNNSKWTQIDTYTEREREKKSVHTKCVALAWVAHEIRWQNKINSNSSLYSLNSLCIRVLAYSRHSANVSNGDIK